ncbi:hypothetical protein BDQ17DRAFT_1546914 [Cyathus striatus]|nr:hypothetical protein BDQ17DRAFT_1546914 [Cyathus striatus]
MFKSLASFAIATMMLIGVANAFDGDATYYSAGLGNCGNQSKDSDSIVALSTQEYNGGAHCGKHINV